MGSVESQEVESRAAASAVRFVVHLGADLRDKRPWTLPIDDKLTAAKGVMASSEWMEIYRAYTPEEIETEITTLKNQATLYTQQTSGEKSYTKDLIMVQNRLQAAIRIRNERTIGARRPAVAFPDFSNFGPGN